MNRPWKLSAFALVPSLLAVSLLVGCGGSAPTPTPSSPAPEAPVAATPAPAPAAPAQGVIKVPQDALPIGDYMPPLDDDRVELAKPQGWQALPRDSDYLTRFYETDRNSLPRIEITVEPKTYGEISTVTPENVEQFAKLVAAELGDLKLVEDVLPMQVGQQACARYVGRVELRNPAGNKISTERQRILVLQEGRLYTIDLLVLPNTLRRSRNAAYAVCASMRFGGGGATPPPTGELLPE